MAAERQLTVRLREYQVWLCIAAEWLCIAAEVSRSGPRMGWSGRAPALPARQAGKGPCLIGMEACTGAHHLSRKLQALGHDARLMPTNYVRPYSKTRMTIATLKRSPKQCNVRRGNLLRPRRPTNLICKPCVGCGAVAAILSGMLRFEHTGMGHGASQQNWQPMSAWGQKHALPQCNGKGRFTPISGLRPLRDHPKRVAS